MNQKTSKIKHQLGIITILICLGFISNLTAQEVIVFSESFETDGSAATGDGRYTVENPSDDGENDYFARREETSIGNLVRGGAIDGDWFWGARDMDGDGTAIGDLAADEGRVTWEPFSISGIANFVLTLAAGQMANEVEFDNVLALQYRVDEGEWLTVGGFRGTYTNSPGRYFVGDLRTLPPNTNPRVTRTFVEHSWDIFAKGETMQFRVFVNANGSTENYAFDNVVITGQSGLPSLGLSTSADSLPETAGSGALAIDFSLEQAAPAGGLTVTLSDSDADNSELDIPAEVNIPEGQTSFSLPVDVLDDGRFDGDELVFIFVSAPGYARDALQITTTNDQEKPNLVMTEVYPTPNRDFPETDSNQDGVTHNTDDEFVEIVNLEEFAVDISGWPVTDDLGPRHIMPEGTVLNPGQAVVVFGGGDPTGVFGGAIVLTASTGNIGPSTERDTMTLVAGGVGGAPVTAFAYAGEVGTSERSGVLADETSGAVVDIQTITGEGGAIFTPGLRNDGTPWEATTNRVILDVPVGTVAEDGDAITATLTLESAGSELINVSVSGENADEVTIEPSSLTVTDAGATVTITPVNDGDLDGDRLVRLRADASGIFPDVARLTVTEVSEDVFDLVINEALSSVVGTGADPNNNGLIEEPIEDLFIEIVNASDSQVNLGNWQLEAYYDVNLTGAEVVHVFPNPTVLASNGSIVIFGDGDVAAMNAAGPEVFGNAVIQLANRGGNGVNLPTGDGGIITLKTPFGFEEDTVSYSIDIADQSMSITRNPDITGDFGALHFDVSTAFEFFSPGRRLDGTPFPGNGAVEVAGAAEVLGGTELGGGWYLSDWFGSFNTSLEPWIFHEHHGFLYLNPDSTSGDSLFFFDLGMSAWFWTSSTLYPNLFVFDPQADLGGTDIGNEWVFFFVDPADPRAFAVLTGSSAGQFLQFGRSQ